MKNRFEISIVFVLLSLGALNAQVGIGTTTPSTSLQVESNAAGEFGLLSSNLTGTGASINFQDQTTTSRFHVGISARGNDMFFRVGNSPQARFDANGLFGIGVPATPATRLHVESNGAGEFGLLSSNFTGSGAGINFQDQTTTSRFHVGISAVGNNMFFRVGNSPQARFDANGSFGIGVPATPATRLHVESNGAGEFGLLSSNFTGNGAGINFQDQTTTSRFHVGIAAYGNNMNFRVGNAYQATLTSGGYFGIGTLTPHAPIHLANFLGNNRQILLYEEANDNHQFYGFGINASVLRYQIANLSASHVFYGGLNATTSNELFRIRGNGSVGVGGVAAPVAKLEVNGYIKVGTTDDIADPVAPVPGMIRYNSTTDRFEGYCGPLAPGGAGWKTLN